MNGIICSLAFVQLHCSGGVVILVSPRLTNCVDELIPKGEPVRLLK